MKTGVLVLGGTGMLGSLVADYLSRQPGLSVAATARSEELAAVCRQRLAGVRWRSFDASCDGDAPARAIFEGCDWVINCIGVIKPLIRDDNALDVERAVRVNAQFPHLLARATEGTARVLQIATDCVYSGTRGRYREGDPHDPHDVYGKTKSLGEARAPHVHHLRCSIVGPEATAPRSLLGWFLGQPRNGAVNGFVNHHWNGVTTLHFAKLCGGVIERGTNLPHLHHVTPQGSVTKCEMLQCFARSYGRDDVAVRPIEAAVVVDRTLTTENEPLNRELWAAAGYVEPPGVSQMIEELARFDSRWKSLSRSASPGGPPAGPA